MINNVRVFTDDLEFLEKTSELTSYRHILEHMVNKARKCEYSAEINEQLDTFIARFNKLEDIKAIISDLDKQIDKLNEMRSDTKLGEEILNELAMYRKNKFDKTVNQVDYNISRLWEKLKNLKKFYIRHMMKDMMRIKLIQ